MDIPVTKIKYCERCQSEQLCKLVRNITASGISQVYWLCPVCNDNISKPGTNWISHDKIKAANIDIESLPIIKDYRGREPCAVCGSTETEHHHWAPWHLFKGDPDWSLWPTVYLCREHHRLWHQRVTPDMGKRR